MARKIILDVDTGSDDACAILLAALHPEIDLVAVCSVNGNQPLENTTENTLRVLELIKSDIPVYKGCTTALVRDCCPWRIPFDNRADAVDASGKKVHIHDPYLPLPQATKKVEDTPAPMFYIDYLTKATEKITIVAVGPLTNLATALIMRPEITEKIEEIVIMGGCWNIGNASSSAEFNIFDDPEAAQRVFSCGVKITMVPLDATHKVVVTIDDVAELKQIGTNASLFAAGQIERRILVHDQAQPLEIPHSCALHDPLAVAYLIDSSVLSNIINVHCDVSLSGNTDGTTVIDQCYFQKNRNVWFGQDGDRKKFVEILKYAYSLDNKA